MGRSGDSGIDGIIKEDRLGLDTIYVQAKRWEAPVGQPEIQKFAGALHFDFAIIAPLIAYAICYEHRKFLLLWSWSVGYRQLCPRPL